MTAGSSVPLTPEASRLTNPEGEATSTAQEMQETAPEVQAVFEGFGKQQLLENFQSIVRAEAIYYPVAYRLIRRIGAGRQGVVFLAERQGSRGCVTRHAVKLFDPSIYPNAKKYWTDMGRIANQVSRLHGASSPNLVDCDTYEESNGIGYMQMEHIGGLDLRRFLDADHVAAARRNSNEREWRGFLAAIFNFDDDRLRVQPGVAVYVMRQMLAGLETLHRTGYLHCDIKPGNTMIDRLGYVKLIDFGRAVLVNERSRVLFGSPAYMAPELHENREPTRRSDLYSVGLVGLELMRGRPLGDGKIGSEAEMLTLKNRLPAMLPNLVPPYVLRNQFLMRMLTRLLDPNPAGRYESAEAAESAKEGLALVHKQLTHLGMDSDYRRDLASYLEKTSSTALDPGFTEE